MKKILVFVLVMAMVMVGLTACGSKKAAEKAADTAEQAAATVEEKTEEAAEAVEEKAEEAAEAVEEKVEEAAETAEEVKEEAAEAVEENVDSVIEKVKGLIEGVEIVKPADVEGAPEGAVIGITVGEKNYWFNADSVAAITAGEKLSVNENGEVVGADGAVVASPIAE